MKKILLAASALSLLTAGAANAQVAHSVTVTAQVADACGLGGTAWNSGAVNVTLPITDDGRLGGADHNPGGFTTNDLLTADELFGDVTVWCNAPATVTVSGEPLHLPGAVYMPEGVANPALPAGFTDYLPLTLRTSSTDLFSVAGYEFPVDLNTGAGLDNATKSQSMDIPSAFEGELEGALKYWGQEGRRFIAGTYTANWSISIAPQM